LAAAVLPFSLPVSFICALSTSITWERTASRSETGLLISSVSNNYALCAISLVDNHAIMQVVAGATDDPGFVDSVNALIAGLINRYSPQQLWIIHIDNWFDHKWLRFSGMGAVASNIPIDRYDTVKAESYQEKLTFPPFAPNRVLEQFSYVRIGEAYVESALPLLPHSNERRRSEDNLRRRMEQFTHHACFLWYSANTLTNGRASVMMYRIQGDRIEAWYAAFNRQNGWNVQATKGVSSDNVQVLIDSASR
jgi:hypothetical protein